MTHSKAIKCGETNLTCEYDDDYFEAPGGSREERDALFLRKITFQGRTGEVTCTLRGTGGVVTGAKNAKAHNAFWEVTEEPKIGPYRLSPFYADPCDVYRQVMGEL